LNYLRDDIKLDAGSYTLGGVLLFALIALFIAFPLFSFGGTVPGTGTAPSYSPRKLPLYETSGRASLLITNTQPLEVSGRGFKAGEQVRVRALGKRRSVTAGHSGRFVVRFGAARCPGGVIVAVGSKGSHASIALSQLLCVEQ
jgi:hypothetical protein